MANVFFNCSLPVRHVWDSWVKIKLLFCGDLYIYMTLTYTDHKTWLIFLKPWYQLCWKKSYDNRNFTKWLHSVSTCTHSFYTTFWEIDWTCLGLLYKSYWKFSQNTSIFKIVILIGFPGDRYGLYMIKRKINTIKIISNQDINIYGVIFEKIVIELLVLQNNIVIVFWTLRKIFQKFYSYKNCM